MSLNAMNIIHFKENCNYWWFYMKLIDQPSYNLSWMTFGFVAFRFH